MTDWDPMGMYDRYNQLQKLTEMYPMDPQTTPLGYEKFVQTGDLEFWDYGRGFLCIKIYTAKAYKVDGWCVRMPFCTVDDGDMGAWSQPMPEAKAREIVERVAQEWLKPLHKLPRLEQLNIDLRPYGLYACYE